MAELGVGTGRATDSGGRGGMGVLEGWQSWLAQTGPALYIFLFVLLLVEEAGVPFPLPGYLVMMYLGFQFRDRGLESLPLLIIAALAVSAGSGILYTVAYVVGRPLLGKMGRFGSCQASRIDRIECWFERRGMLVVVAGRLVPNLRNPTSLASGFLRLPPHIFLPGTATAAVIWSAGYFFLGLALGAPGNAVGDWMGAR